MGDVDTAEARSKAAAATRGPWFASLGTAVMTVRTHAQDTGWLVCTTPLKMPDIDGPNAEFIAYARAFVPAACDEIDRLRAELAHLNEAFATMRHAHADASAVARGLRAKLAEAHAARDAAQKAEAEAIEGWAYERDALRAELNESAETIARLRAEVAEAKAAMAKFVENEAVHSEDMAVADRECAERERLREHHSQRADALRADLSSTRGMLERAMEALRVVREALGGADPRTTSLLSPWAHASAIIDAALAESAAAHPAEVTQRAGEETSALSAPAHGVAVEAAIAAWRAIPQSDRKRLFAEWLFGAGRLARATQRALGAAIALLTATTSADAEPEGGS